MAEGNVCAICLETLKNGKVLLTTVCEHVFHYECITSNARINNNRCPLCRKPIQCSFESLPASTDNVNENHWSCSSCTFLNSQNVDVCSVCGQGMRQQVTRGNSDSQPETGSSWSNSSTSSHLPCYNTRCHSRDSASNFLCDYCVSNNGLQGTTTAVSHQNVHSSELHTSSTMGISEEVVQIAEELQLNTAYRDLNLRSKKITLDEMRVISEGLKYNTTVNKLNLDSCELTNDHAQLLAEVLQHNKALTKLSLGYNKIGDAGVIIIAEVLKHNTTLTDLRLNSNNIGDTGIMMIVETLKCNRTLSDLSLDRCHIGDVGGTALADALIVNQTLKCLDMSNNKLSGPVKTMIDEAFRKHNSNSMYNLRL